MLLRHYFWGPHSTGPESLVPTQLHKRDILLVHAMNFFLRDMRGLARAAQLIP